MEENAIEKFIAKSQQQNTPPSNDFTTDDWEGVAPGIDPTDFQPKNIPIPPPPPPIIGPGLDSGRTPNSFLVNTKKDIEDFFAEPGVCGLINLGNTCYMNAGLQCLRSIPRIAEFYLTNHSSLSLAKKEEETDGSSNEEKEENNSPQVNTTADAKVLARGHVSARFSALIKKIWAGRFSSVIPRNFKTTLGLLYSQFGGFRQQDCQEFLVLLLDCLHEDICHSLETRNVTQETENLAESQTKTKQLSSVITDSFQGQLKNEVTCSVCGHVSVKYDPFVYLSVPIPHSHEKQITVFWSSVINNSRHVIKLLVTVPILCSVQDLKSALCQMLGGGGVKPDHVIIAHIKNHAIESTLGNSLAIKNVNEIDYRVYAFHVETLPSAADDSAQSSDHSPSTDGYMPLPDSADPVPMETSSASNDPWQPVHESDELPHKIHRSEDDSETMPLLEDSERGEEPPPKVVIMEWHSCVICLEEMIDSDLLTHSSCGATICSTCLQASRSHSGTDSGHMPCPVCQVMVAGDGFVALASSDHQSEVVIRLLQLTILFRNESSDGSWALIGHPCLLNLPSTGSVDQYYRLIAQIVPSLCQKFAWSIALTDSKGRYCSRCTFGSGCHGCVLSNAMQDVSLKPGDFLSVSFYKLPSDVIQEVDKAELHPSLDSRWPSSVSLQDCLDLFSQKEVLGSDNPWWCPTCKANQIAVRQLMISNVPPSLIVHLKRFLFHDNNASKVDVGVGFPPSLSVSSLSQTPAADDVSDFSLVSCVCHFGSLNSGHYTAYSRHSVTDKWYYYNDETVTEAQPSNKDNESVYILFYHQKGSSTCDLPTERGGSFPSEEEELLQLEPLLRIMKPKPKTPPPAPPTLIKRSSSTGNLTDTADNNDIHLQQQLAASLGLDLPATPTHNAMPSIRSSSSNPSLVTATQQQQPLLPLAKSLDVSVQMKSFDC